MIPGPGHYSPEKTDAIVRSSSPSADFKNKSSRKDLRVEPNLGPGYYVLDNTNDTSKQMTIGVKHEERLEKTPGPGEYSAEKAD